MDRLKVFEKLLNQLKLLDNQFNLSNYNYQIQDFINKILGKYEDYIEQIFRENPNSHILDQLYHQVQNYIKLYSEFFESMTNNRKRNNPIYEIIKRLNFISDQISIKKSILSQNRTNKNGYQLSNEMKRRINLLHHINKYKKDEDYNSILRELFNSYQSNRVLNVKELYILAQIGSKIKSISRILNKNNKQILLIDLGKTINKLRSSLNKYNEFNNYEIEYKKLITSE